MDQRQIFFLLRNQYSLVVVFQALGQQDIVAREGSSSCNSLLFDLSSESWPPNLELRGQCKCLIPCQFLCWKLTDWTTNVRVSSAQATLLSTQARAHTLKTANIGFVPKGLLLYAFFFPGLFFFPLRAIFVFSSTLNKIYIFCDRNHPTAFYGT